MSDRRETAGDDRRSGAESSFSEKEVALVLRRAAEIEASGTGAAGMTAADIEAVALEAGIQPDAVRRAIEEMRLEPSSPALALLPPPSRRAARAIPVELGREALGELVHSIEDRVGRPGSVSEALGTVRWTSTSGMWTTQVSIGSGPGETRIGVHERAADRERRLFHALPAGWGTLLAGAVAMSGVFPLSALGLLGLLAGGAAAGFGIGRTVFAMRSKASRERVERLAADLSEEARRLEELDA